jgi:Fe-S-cluster-containing hydrogenase component 2
MKRDPDVGKAMTGSATVYSGPLGALLWSGPDCHDCSGCVAACPFDALEIREGIVHADMERCTLCTICDRVCPTGAITIDRAVRSTG